jgi:hypothetical protein
MMNRLGLVLWGLADDFVDEVINVYRSREDAERALEAILDDEPEWEGKFRVVPLLLAEYCPN